MSAPAAMHPAIHGHFTIERTYPVSPERVFEALTDIATKARWFDGPPGWTLEERTLDVRPGGREVLAGIHPNGKRSRFEARYHEIVPDARLVYVYDMHVGGSFMSTSLATMELEAVKGGTRLTFTEQAVYFDGEDGNASRQHGTGILLDQLGAALAGIKPSTPEC